MEKALEKLRELLDEAVHLASGRAFDSMNRQHLILVSLLGSVLEYADGGYLALRHSNGTTAFVALRSALEAHVDLSNIASDPDYAYVMHAINLSESRKMIRSGTRPGALGGAPPEGLERLTALLAGLRELWKQA